MKVLTLVMDTPYKSSWAIVPFFNALELGEMSVRQLAFAIFAGRSPVQIDGGVLYCQSS